jgi:hypothetical protein
VEEKLSAVLDSIPFYMCLVVFSSRRTAFPINSRKKMVTKQALKQVEILIQVSEDFLQIEITGGAQLNASEKHKIRYGTRS